MKRFIGALLLAICCAGCTSTRATSGSPQAAGARVPVAAPEDFAAGLCRTAAEHVIAVGTMADQLRGRTQADIPMSDRVAMAKQQQAVIAMLPKADPAMRKQLQDLVTALGFARLRLDVRTYRPGLMDDVAKAEASIRTTCVH